MITRFGAFEFDQACFKLRRHGEVVPLPALALDTLAFFLRSGGKLVTVDELIGGPWRGHVVTPSAVRQVIVTLRRALTSDEGGSSFLATVRGRGFRFEGAPPKEQTPRQPEAEVLRARPSFERLPVFVGRAHELEVLRGASDDAALGSGGLVLLVGAPGLGKTALAERFAREAAGRGYEVLSGWCWEQGGAPPLWPWPEILRGWRVAHGPNSLEELVPERLPDLARLLPELEREGGERWTDSALDESAVLRLRVFDAVNTFLQRCARIRPLMVLLEDVHRADPSAVLLLEYLVRAAAGSPLMIVATCRPLESEVTPSLQAASQGAWPATRVLTLSGLSGADIEQWLHDAGAAADHGGALERRAKVLHQLTGGHPLLVRETLHRTPDPMMLFTAGSALPGPIQLPARLTGAINQRLGKLPPPTRELVQTAALLGREFLLPDLPPKDGAVEADDMHRHVQTLTPAVSAGIIEPLLGRALHFRFSHDLVRETLMTALPLAERLAQHARIARHLLSRPDRQDDALVFRMAHHALAGQSCLPATEVLDSALHAAERARQSMAYELSESLCVAGLAVPVPEGADGARRRAALMLALGNACVLLGRSAEGEAHYVACAEYALAHDLPESLAHAIQEWFDLLGETAAIHPGFRAMVDLAVDRITQPGGVKAQLLCALTVSHFATMPTERVRELLLQARDMVNDDRPALVAFVNRLFRHQQFVGTAAATIALADEALRVLRSRQVRSACFRVRAVKMKALIALGRGTELLAEIRAHKAEAAALRYPPHVLHGRPDSYDFVEAMLAGELETAELAARRIFAVRGDSLPARAFLAVQALSLGIEHAGARRKRWLEESIECSAVVLAVVPDYFPLLGAQVLALAHLGRADESRSILKRLGRGALDAIPDDRNRPNCLAALAWAAALVREDALLPELVRALEPLADRHIAADVEAYLGPVPFYLGELHRTGGDAEEARRWFERAVVESERACGRPWVARCRAALRASMTASPR